MPNIGTSNYFVHTLLRARDWQHRPELEHLCDWWRALGGGLYALVGIGGAGKTATIERFLQIVPGGSPEPLDPTHAPPRRPELPATVEPFIFSFYDVPNEDSFFVELAGWLSRVASDCRPASLATDGVEKIPQAHLAQWLQNLARQRERTLLVLDGLEKVQDDGRRSGMYGHILDGRLRNLLLDIAEGRFGRLAAVLTTRFDLYDPAAQRVPYYWRTFVEQLAVETCVDLLRARGVQEPDDDRPKRLAVEHGCHALTVDLIGGYIGEFCGGDVSKLKPLGEIDFSDIDIRLHPRRKAVIEQERRFARVAERYQETLREQEPATLALLQRLCLFRLGVDAAMLTSIFTGDDESTRKVAGPALAALSPEQLQQTLDRLTAMKLVEAGPVPTGQNQVEGGNLNATDRPVGTGPTYTIHPAVRDGFLSGIAASDRTAGHEAARAGLTAALGDSPGKNPSDPATLDLLEEIVHHTLQSGHAKEAWDVYWNRIGNFTNLGHRLGAYERGERLCRALAGGQSAESLFGRRPSITVAWGNAPGIEQPSHGLAEGHVHPGRDEDGLQPSDTSAHSSPGALPQATVTDGLRPNEAPFLALPEDDQAIFLNEWAMYLSELGRLEAAAHCYELDVEIGLQLENWRHASIYNQNLCEVRFLSGRLKEKSEERSETSETISPVTLLSSPFREALRLAELADDAAGRSNSYAYRGHARALLGEVPTALADFHDALDWQHKVDDDDNPLYTLRGIQHTSLLARLGRREESQRLTEANQEMCLQHFGAGNFFEPPCQLLLASLQLDSGDVSAAERLCHAARDWALARDAKEVLCWSALVQARVELAQCSHLAPRDEPGAETAPESKHRLARQSGTARPTEIPQAKSFQNSPSTPTAAHIAERDGKYAAAQSAIDDGLKIARACGFSLFHIDLHVELARLRLLQGQPSEALAALDTALNETRPKNAKTGEPELLAALDPCCGYAWPVPEALQLKAEALLLQAAQEMNSSELITTSAIEMAEESMRKIWQVEQELDHAVKCRASHEYTHETIECMVKGRRELVLEAMDATPQVIMNAVKQPFTELRNISGRPLNGHNVAHRHPKIRSLVHDLQTAIDAVKEWHVTEPTSVIESVERKTSEARILLTEALELWQPLHDPERPNQNFQLNRKQYNHQAAETHRVLTDLEAGILTRYSLCPTAEDSTPAAASPPTTEHGTTEMRDQVFISYSHLDQDWLDKLLATLKPLTHR